VRRERHGDQNDAYRKGMCVATAVLCALSGAMGGMAKANAFLIQLDRELVILCITPANAAYVMLALLLSSALCKPERFYLPTFVGKHDHFCF
jgi:hypothetical protein